MNLNLKIIYQLLTFGDKTLIMLLFSLSLGSLFFIKGFTQTGEFALVTVPGESEIKKSLANEERFTISGPVGISVIEVVNHSIHVTHSECPQKLCVYQGAIKNVGEIIVCVPNKLTISIEGKKRKKNKFDAITG